MAESCALIGQREEALDWLESAVGRGFTNYRFLSRYDRFLEPIRGEERFQKLMERTERQWKRLET